MTLFAFFSTLLLAAFAFATEARAHTAYVVDRWSNAVFPVDLATATVDDPIQVGNRPVGAAITPDGRRAYVANLSSPSVSVVDTQTSEVIDTISVTDAPYHVAVAPDGKSVYVSRPTADAVAVIDTATNTVGKAFSTGDVPYALAVAPDGRAVYAVNASDDTVSVIDTETEEVSTIPVGQWPSGIAFTPDGSFAYVSNFDSSSISVIDTQSKEVVETIETAAWPTAMGMNPDGKIAYVTHWDEPGSVSVIDTKTNAVVETISVDPLPVSIAVDPGGETAYVYSAAGRTLTPIDTATHAAGDPITVTGPSVDGTEAVVAITPNQSPVPRLAAPATAYVGDPVVFDASGSADDTDIETYGFDFGDGAQATSAQPIRRHVYSEPGTYEATLTLDDGVGCEPVPELFGLGLASPFTGQTAHCSGPSLVTSEPVTIEVREPDTLRLLVGLARPQRSLRRVQVSAACGAIDCRVRASGKVRARHPSKKARTFELIPATSELTAGTAGMLRPAIPPAAREAARKAVAAGGKVKAKVRVVAKAPVHQRGVRVHWVRVLPR